MKGSWRILSGLFFILVLSLAACGSTTTPSTPGKPAASSSTPVTLNIFAAASLTESFNQIKQDYQATHPNIKITYNFNGSQALEQQIANGASADIFASADAANMKKASDAGLVDSSQVFAQNKLVCIVPTSNPGHITTLKDLAKPGVKIDFGAPAVPVGKYGLQILDKLGKSPDYGAAYEKSVKANIVSQEENVKAVVQKVELGEADAGIVYLTDVTSAASGKVTKVTIPDQYNVIANYPIAVTKNDKNSTEAQAFITYLLSSSGQSVLTRYHFISVSHA